MNTAHLSSTKNASPLAAFADQQIDWNRNSESADDLVTVPLPEPLVKAFRDEYGSLKGVFEPLPVIKDWLKKELGQA